MPGDALKTATSTALDHRGQHRPGWRWFWLLSTPMARRSGPGRLVDAHAERRRPRRSRRRRCARTGCASSPPRVGSLQAAGVVPVMFESVWPSDWRISRPARSRTGSGGSAATSMLPMKLTLPGTCWPSPRLMLARKGALPLLKTTGTAHWQVHPPCRRSRTSAAGIPLPPSPAPRPGKPMPMIGLALLRHAAEVACRAGCRWRSRTEVAAAGLPS